MEESAGVRAAAAANPFTRPFGETTRSDVAVAEVYNQVLGSGTNPPDSPSIMEDFRQLDVRLEPLRPIPVGSESEHMMLVSPSFEILMLHPAFEAVWHRPASTFIGKKCYREIEKRDAPCPHCPGVIALHTGATADAEACASLDDGTRVPFLLRAYPIFDAKGAQAGFVEVCQNIAAHRRFEDDVRTEVVFARDLLDTSSSSRVLTLALDAALQLEGAHSGCVVLVDPITGARELVAQRGLSPEEIDHLPTPLAGAAVTVMAPSWLLVRAPINCNSQPVAELMIRVADGGESWSNSQPRLEVLAAISACALLRIKADRLRGDAGVNIEKIFGAIPAPAVFLDQLGRVKGWNDEADAAFGWSQNRAIGQTPSFLEGGEHERLIALLNTSHDATRTQTAAFQCRFADGLVHDLVLRAVPILDVQGNGSAYCVISTTPHRVAPPVFGAPASRGSGSASVPWIPTEAEGANGYGPAAAQALYGLFETIRRGLKREQNQEASAGTESDGLTAGRVSVSWSEEGSLDIQYVPAQTPRRVTEDMSGPRVLVIQANHENGMELDRLLRSFGCPVATCDSLSTGLARLASEQSAGQTPDLAIIDMTMPSGPGGLEAAQLLRMVEPSIRVAVSSDHRVAGHVAHGFVAALKRPYTSEAVGVVIEQVRTQLTLA